jgi:hypothetical protein
MMNRIECRDLVEAIVDRIGHNGSRLALTGQFWEFRYSWAFGVNSRRFVETGDQQFALSSQRPILVDKVTGAMITAPADVPLKQVASTFAAEQGHRPWWRFW